MGNITTLGYTWNRPKTTLFPGGTQRTAIYDALMRLHSLTVTDPGGTPLLNYAYTYDPIGNITVKATEHGNYTFGYDPASRLTSADNPVLADETYTYDNVGNRQTATGISGNWNYNTNNELLGFADVEYVYDANGNMTQKKVGTAAVNYIYNPENRLIRVEDDLTKLVMAEYGYDPFGRRLWKDVAGVQTYFFYSEEGLIAEYDANGNELKSYGYKPDSTWGTDPLWLKQGGQYYFYQNDHLGTPQKLVAQNGAVVWSASYEAFGKAQVDVETVVNHLRFPGQYFDAETRLNYNFQRYYEPGSGRYVSVDPIKFAGGDINWYGYAQNNPLNSFDSSGKGSWTDVEKGDLFYTWNLGWVDVNHAYTNTDTLIDAWKKMRDARIGELISFTLKGDGALVHVEADFCVIVAASKRDRKQQLLHAWKIFSEHFEKAQGKWFFDWDVVNQVGGLVLKHNVDQTPSSFSTEDLVSNLVYFYAVVNADYSLAKNKSGKGMVRDKAIELVTTFGGKFDADAEQVISRALWSSSLKVQPGYNKWEPQYFHEKFLSFDFSGQTVWSYPTVIYTENGPVSNNIPFPKEFYELGAKAQQFLLDYRMKHGNPNFSAWTAYREMSEGYLYIQLR